MGEKVLDLSDLFAPEKGAAPEPQELYYYRVIFESGMPEIGGSDLAPAEFEKAVFETEARVQWKDLVDVLDANGRTTGKLRATAGGAFRCDRVISVRWVEPSQAGS